MSKYTPKTKPYPHQSRATVRALKAKNFGIFMEPRTGKTKVALDYCGVMAMKKPGLKVAVLCPATVVETWLAQIGMHFPHYAIVEDSTYEYDFPGNTDYITQFLILSHEEIRHRTRKAGKYTYTRQKEFESFRPDVVIDDESHRHKRAGGVGAQFLWRSLERMRIARDDGKPYVLLLTGTPTPKDWRDIFAQYRIMDPSIFGTSKADFEDLYCIYGKAQWNKWNVVKWPRKRELLRKIRDHSITVTEEEAGLVNKKFIQRFHFELPAQAKKLYNEMAEHLVAEIEDGVVIDAANAGVRRLRLLQIVGGFTTEGSIIHQAGLDRTRQYVQLLAEQDQPFILYARFSPEVRALVRLCREAKLDVGQIVGGQTRHDRTEAIKRFQEARGVRAMVAQVDAASVGIELSAAREVVYYSLPDGWESWRQSMSRVLGPNQRGAVRYTILQARGTLAPSVLQGLIRKEDIHAEMMRNPRRFLGLIQ